MLDIEDIRYKTIKLSCETGAGHLAPSLSCLEMLVVLFNDYLKFDKDNVFDDGRDRLIFSKGHGAYSYYVILNELGIIPNNEIENFYKNSSLKGCLTYNPKYMLEASTGSLGHGLPIAVGMAQSFKMQNKNNKVICIVGDGEMQEGSNFEALQLASRFKLDNLLIIVDGNKLQAMDRVEDVGLSNNQLANVLKAYPCNFSKLDGHNILELKRSFDKFFKDETESFSVMFCDTIKGKGIDFMENSIKYHYRCPVEDGFVLKGSNE